MLSGMPLFISLFLLVWRDIQDWLTCREQKCILFTALEAEEPKSTAQHLLSIW